MSAPEKIAIVANSCWNLYNFRRPLIRRLRREGYEIWLLARKDGFYEHLHEEECDGFIPLRNLKPSGLNPVEDALLYRELVSVFERLQFDLVLTFTIKANVYGCLAARRAGMPCIPTITGLGYAFLHRWWVEKLAVEMYRSALRNHPLVVFQNADDRAFFLDRAIVAKGQAVLIPGSGVDVDFFRPVSKPAGGPFTFLFTGRLLRDKGIGEYAAAAYHLRRSFADIDCRVIGQLDAENPSVISPVQLAAWQREKRIRYEGFQLDVRSHLAAADAVVLPSYREGLPRALLEAMAMEKPIITTDVPGCRETVVKGRNGFLVRPAEVEDLAAAMERMYRLDSKRRKVMGIYGRRKVLAEFDQEIVCGKYLESIRDVQKTNAYARQPVRTSAAVL
ncbi:MAG: glycosyltransferase family 4 protein [Saprospiraceae bacterium]|nr:glycosyltransferase family 4 protein [Saprospiraceae bacterium]